MTRPRKPQHGLALVNAIFLLVVLAALGAYMVSVGGVQQATTTQALIAARVNLGAKSGLEWSINRVISPSPPTTCFSSPTSFALSGSGLQDINVAVNCSATGHVVGPTTYYVYYLTSTATHGTAGDPDYAARRMEAAVSNVPN